MNDGLSVFLRAKEFLTNAFSVIEGIEKFEDLLGIKLSTLKTNPTKLSGEVVSFGNEVEFCPFENVGERVREFGGSFFLDVTGDGFGKTKFQSSKWDNDVEFFIKNSVFTNGAFDKLAVLFELTQEKRFFLF